MGAESDTIVNIAKDLSVPDLPRSLRVAAASSPLVRLTISDAMARELARAIETGLNAAADQERILAKAEAFRAQSIGAAREVLARAEVARGMAKAALERAEGKLQMAFWFDVAALAVVAAFLLVGAGF